MFDSAANEVIKIASFVCAMAYHRPDMRYNDDGQNRDKTKKKTNQTKYTQQQQQKHIYFHWPAIACDAFIKYSCQFFIQTVVMLLTFDKLHRLTSSHWFPIDCCRFFQFHFFFQFSILRTVKHEKKCVHNDNRKLSRN